MLSCVVRRLSLLTPIAASIALVAGCGGSEPEPKTVVDAAPPKVENDADHLHGIRTASEIGGMNEEEVDAAFKKSLGSLEQCLNRGTERVEFLGGKVSFFLKVDANGRIEEAFLEHSTLGDRETEKCMLGALRAKTWPKPVGGQHGLAKKSFEFDPPNDVRPPLEWDAAIARPVLKKLGGKFDDCRRGSSARFEATAYVSAQGDVIAASVTPSDGAGEAAVDCMVDTLRGASFPSPGSWAAKVTFAL